MFVKYNPKVPHMKIIPLLPLKKDGKGYAFDNDSVTLRPGTNELTEEEWEAVQPHIKDLVGRGKEIEPFSVTVKTGKGGKDKKAKTLKDVPVITARKIIEGCQDLETLKKWFNQELPDELLLVVSKRMRKLKVEPDDLKDDGDADLDLKGEDITSEVKTETKSDTVDGDDLKDDGEPVEDDDEVPDFDGSRNSGS